MSDRIREDELTISVDEKKLGALVGASIHACRMLHAVLVLGGARTMYGKSLKRAKRHESFSGCHEAQTELHRALIRSGAKHSDIPPGVTSVR